MEAEYSVRMNEVTVLCDFCAGPELPEWEYPCGDFISLAGGATQSFTGTWKVCPKCRELLETGDTKALMQRVWQMESVWAGAYGKMSRQEASEVMANLLTDFWSNVTGTAMPYNVR